MPIAHVNGIDLCYDTCGNPSHPAVLLIMGASMQLTAWPEIFCRDLVAQGFYVIRFDNRDVGLSQKFDHVQAPNLLTSSLRALCGMKVQAPYVLDDMAQDAMALLDHLNIESAHVMGFSMGGMIGQVMAAKHQPRVRSLISMSSSTGRVKHFLMRMKVLAATFLNTPKTQCVDEIVEYYLRYRQAIGGPSFPMPEQVARKRLRRSIERSYNPMSFLRHTAAILASGSREHLLPQIQAPTLVLHGTHDPVIAVSGAKETAAHIPGAQLELIEGAGHHFPDRLLPRIGKSIGNHLRRAESKVSELFRRQAKKRKAR